MPPLLITLEEVSGNKVTVWVTRAVKLPGSLIKAKLLVLVNIRMNFSFASYESFEFPNSIFAASLLFYSAKRLEFDHHKFKGG